MLQHVTQLININNTSSFFPILQVTQFKFDFWDSSASIGICVLRNT